MKVVDFILISVLLIFTLTQTGCASFNRKLKNFLGGTSAESQQSASTLTKFSESPDVAPRVKRQYKRTTKETLADEASLDSKAGSLWVMEGQGAYLFSQNVVRLVGDPLAIQLEGDPKDQLQSKVSVIKKLLAKIEERQKARLRDPAGGEKDDEKAKDKKEKAQETAQKDQLPEAPGELGIKNV
ncbi:MAG TPA: hypothetical protein PKC28_11985, partial [Bdellovibrionales bacterium]|nr:hypothetical protein [Bdellovibrionales bacterium]